MTWQNPNPARPWSVHSFVARKAFALMLVVFACAPAASARAADLLASVEDAYALRRLPRASFEPGTVPGLAADEGRFLRELFELTDEAVLLDTDVARWLVSGGERGLHAAAYLGAMTALRGRLAALEAPPRVVSVRRGVADALALQQGFVSDWYSALEQGRPFASQLTDEYAYHEGLARSQKLLLRAYVDLRALFPGAGEAAHAAFRDRLRAVSFR